MIRDEKNGSYWFRTWENSLGWSYRYWNLPHKDSGEHHVVEGLGRVFSISFKKGKNNRILKVTHQKANIWRKISKKDQEGLLEDIKKETLEMCSGHKKE